MLGTTIRRILILLLVALFALGCGGKKRATATPIAPAPTAEARVATATPAPARAEEAAAPAAPQEAKSAVESVDTSAALQALQELGNYRATMTISWTEIKAGQTTTGTVTLNGDYIPSQSASRITWSASRSQETVDATAPRSFAIITIGQKRWMQMGEHWVEIGLGEEEAMGSGMLIEPQDIIGNIDSARLVKTGEEIDGIRTRHYRFDEATAPLFSVLPLLSASGASGEGRWRGDVWVAEEGGFLVKYTATVEAAITDAEEGTVTAQMQFDYSIYDVGASFTIEPPAGAGEALPGFDERELPMPEGANVTVAMPNMKIIAVPLPLAEAVAFYEEALGATGWSKEGSEQMGDQAMVLSFRKGDASLRVTLTWDAGQGQTQVILASE